MLKFKTCYACGLTKSLEEFYKDERNRDGRRGDCKMCAKARMRAIRRNNKAYYQEYDRKRNALPERQQIVSERKRVYREKWPEKKRAQDKVHAAVARGKLIKQPCEICGSKVVQAHHEDYSKPLDVIWLCAVHHKWIHS